MRVSIITPSFNQAPFLGQTIESVLQQDHQELEYIVVDGASSDGSVDVIQQYDKQLAYWISEPDQGQVDAITKGIRRATGDVLAWVNSDDTLMPSAVRIAAEYLKSNPSVGLIYGDRLHIDKRGNVIHVNRGPSYYGAMLRRNITIPQETTFFRRTAYEQVGGLDPELHFSMDFDLWCRLAQVTKVKHIPAFMACFREHTASKSLIAQDGHDSVGGRFRREHEEVYRRHFHKNLPSPVRMRCYMLLHKLRFAWESQSRAYRAEREQVRKIVEVEKSSPE